MTIFRNDISVLGLVFLGKYTTAQRTSLAALLTTTDAGGLIYDTDLQTLYYFNGTAFVTFSSIVNLSLGTITATTVPVTNSAGTGFTIPSATTTLAGLLPAASFVNYNANLTLSGIAAGVTTLGTFTGTTIPDNQSIKAALQALETTTEAFYATKAAANGLASLDATGKIPTTQLPSLAITDVYVVANIAARNALTVQAGDVAKVTDSGAGFPQTYIYDGTVWVDIQESSDVISVNGLTGVVSLTAATIPYSNVGAPVGSPTVAATTTQGAIDALNVSLNTSNNRIYSTIQSFTVASWPAAVSGKHTLVIASGLTGTLTNVQVQQEISANVFNVVGATVQIDNTTKAVSITVRAVPDARFAGRVIINQS